MEVYERVKELRKNFLKMSQTAFGQQLGVSRDVIKNIELNVLAKPEQKLSLLKLICKEFSVNEEWLLYGNGDMFINNDTKYDALINKIMNGENEFAKNIFKTFALFDEEDWEALQHMIETYATISAVTNSSPAESISETTEELENIYKKSRLNSAQNTDYSASNIIKNTEDIKTKEA